MPRAERLVMYGAPSEEPPLAWEWVDTQLTEAGVYWVVAPAEGYPHPRPVWGAWVDSRLYLSVGSPAIHAALAHDTDVTVHLGGDVDVVIIEGTVSGSSEDSGVVDRYNEKYDWDYRIAEYGAFKVVRPAKVMAWRAGGWAGREGFKQTGRWRLDPAVEL